MMVKSIPAAVLNSSADRFWVLPILMVPTFSAPGLAFAAAMKSPSVLNSEVALVENTKSKKPRLETGSKSFSGSNGSFLNNETLTAVPLDSNASVCPSGGDEITVRAAAMPPAPG